MCFVNILKASNSLRFKVYFFQVFHEFLAVDAVYDFKVDVTVFENGEQLTEIWRACLPDGQQRLAR